MEKEKKTDAMQTPDRTEAQKQHLYWKQMIAVERQFYDYVLENTEKLLSYNPPRFVIKEDSDEEEPPSYIRHICKLKPGVMAETKERLDHLRGLYELSQGELFKGRYPRRFARIYSNVEQINISMHDAYQSWQLKAGKLPDDPEIKGGITIKELPLERLPYPAAEKVIAKIGKEAQALKKWGLPAEISVFEVMGFLKSVSIIVEEKQLYKRFETRHIQARRKTGTRYNARIRHVGETVSTRHAFGFMLIDEGSPLTEKDIYQGSPRARRPDRLEISGLELAWPNDICPLNYKMYDRNK